MALRNIVKIDQTRCNGCGLCVNACAEGAIAIVDGKARLVSEVYCDGLGACLGHCPQDAISVEEREAAEFDEQATHEHLARQKKVPAQTQVPTMCPGLMAHAFTPPQAEESEQGPVHSQLRHWPVQLKLVSPGASYFNDADLLLTADCVPFAMGDFHNRFLREHSVAVGCPKLDDAQFYIDKLATILSANKVRSLTVVHMEVPCCSGLTRIAQEAIRTSGTVPRTFQDVTIGLQGDVLKVQDMTV
jgi:NAD-dependent dihydropyrimidine dehydrogenase PreA subunit